MKLDIKSILILILLGFSLFFGFKWFFGIDKVSKEIVNQLEKDFIELESQKKIVDTEINNWKFKSDSLEQLGLKIKEELTKQEEITRRAQADANKSKEGFDKLRIELEETKRKIEYIKNNPPNRTGDDLLESLKNKMN